MTIETIIDDILSGSHDDDLDTIVSTIKLRRTALSQSKFLLVKIGARGRLTNLRPKYLVGAPVTVTGRKQTRLEVTIDDDFFTGRYGKNITVTPDMIVLD